MLIEDRLYGQFEIDSPVLMELIGSAAIQRLKGIGQLGVPDEYYYIKNFSRYEHSVGVMLLLRRFGADEKEQIAGLLHDASHTAFSHIIDYVINNVGGDECYQDKHHLITLNGTDLPKILNKHGYNLETIADLQGFSLLEQHIPDLCADRIDYALREYSNDAVQTSLNALTTHEGHFVFKERESALVFSENFINRFKECWSSFEGVNRYYYFGKAVRLAIEDGCIVFDDLKTNDESVTKKLRTCRDVQVQKILKALSAKSLANLPLTGQIIGNKFRYVDPMVLDGGTPKRLSMIDKGYKHELEHVRAEHAKGVPIVLI